MSTELNINLDQIDSDLQFTTFSKDISKHLKAVKKGIAAGENPPAITSAIIHTLREKSADLHSSVKFEEVGTVQHIGNGVASISGLSQASINGLVAFQNGTKGMILNLQTDSLDVILLGEEEGIQGGSLVTLSNDKLKIPVGNALMGRVVNAMGEAIDDGEAIETGEHAFIERSAPSITERSPVNSPLQSGVKMIDALFPIGKGQRELIVGDRQTGKTTLALDTIINQRRKNVICIFVSVGQKKSSLLNAMETLKKHKAMDHSIIVAASPDDPPAQKYIAPFSGMTIAEHFLDEGRDVLIVFDDLTKHADAYRELSLLLRRPPGREAYPGDIFYLHSRLLERAGNIHEKEGGGSITAIPIIATQQGNISAYIPTNLISICDGQIVLSKERFNKGFKPAVNIGISVSRVGGAAQSNLIRSIANRLNFDLSQFEEVEKFTQFGTELDDATQQMITRGQRLQSVLTQGINQPMKVSRQAVSLFAAINGYFDAVPVSQIPEFERQLISWAKRTNIKLMEKMQDEQSFDPEIQAGLSELMHAFSEYRKEKETANE